MKYFNNDPRWYDFKRVVADEIDVLGLIWLTKIKMNKAYILISFILMIGCGGYEVPKKQYEGYVYNNEKKPLVGVVIKESDVKQSNSTKTDLNGYFKMNRSSQNSVPDLIFEKNGYVIDTVDLTRGTHSGKIRLFFKKSIRHSKNEKNKRVEWT